VHGNSSLTFDFGLQGYRNVLSAMMFDQMSITEATLSLSTTDLVGLVICSCLPDHQIRHVSVPAAKLGVNASLSTLGKMEQHGKGTMLIYDTYRAIPIFG
jgi:hypothetical protein